MSMEEFSNSSASTSKVIIQFPHKLWLGNISKKYKYANILITAFVPISHNPFIGNSMITIRCDKIEALLSDLEFQPSLLSYSIMERTKDTITLSTRTKDNLLLRSIVKNFILVKLPVKVYEGKAEFVINGSREDIDQFIEDLSQRGMEVQIMNLGKYSDNLKNIWLTTKQYKVYQEARKQGYYDHPRKITLTNLAGSLGMAKSSLSTMLQRIHNVLLGN